jgi:hypothetical protein
MALSYSISVIREFGMREGHARSVVADVTITGTPTAEDSGGNPLSSQNMITLNMRRIDYIRMGGVGFYDDAAATVIPAQWHSQAKGFMLFGSGAAGAPLGEDVDALGVGGAVARIEFIGV